MSGVWECGTLVKRELTAKENKPVLECRFWGRKCTFKESEKEREVRWEQALGITRVGMAKGGLIWHSKGCCRTQGCLAEDKQVQEADGQAWSCSSHAAAAPIAPWKMHMPPACGGTQTAEEQGCEKRKNCRENGQQARDRRCILVEATALVSAHSRAQRCGRTGQTGRAVPVSCEQGEVPWLLSSANLTRAGLQSRTGSYLTGNAHGQFDSKIPQGEPNQSSTYTQPHAMPKMRER